MSQAKKIGREQQKTAVRKANYHVKTARKNYKSATQTVKQQQRKALVKQLRSTFKGSRGQGLMELKNIKDQLKSTRSTFKQSEKSAKNALGFYKSMKKGARMVKSRKEAFMQQLRLAKEEGKRMTKQF